MKENKQKKLSEEKTDKPIVAKRKDSQTKIKLTYKEQKEKESIEELLPTLEERKQTIERQLSSGELTNEEWLEIARQAKEAGMLYSSEISFICFI